MFRLTRFGLATRAGAEHETGLTLMGISPSRLGFANWIIATVTAGLAIILFAGRVRPARPGGDQPARGPGARGGAARRAVELRGDAASAALAISMAAGALGTFQARADWLGDWLPRGGLAAALPVIVIVVAITVRGRAAADARVARRGPARPRHRCPTGRSPRPSVLSVATIVALFTLDDLWRLAIVVSMLAAIIGLSSVVLTGYLGQISLAQYAFAGLAAFTTAKLAIEGVPFPWSPLLAVALTVGGRDRSSGSRRCASAGMTLAVATLGAAVAIEQLVFASPDLNGLSGVPRPHLFGLDLGFLGHGRDNFRPEFGVLVLVALAVCALGVANLRRSPTGLRWLAVRSNERAAAASGIDVRDGQARRVRACRARSPASAARSSPTSCRRSSPQQFMVIGGPRGARALLPRWHRHDLGRARGRAARVGRHPHPAPGRDPPGRRRPPSSP